MALDRILTPEAAEKLLRAHANDWREDQHPRGKGGKFVSKGSGSMSGSGESENGSVVTATEPKATMREPRRSVFRPGNRQHALSRIANRKAVEKANRSMAQECERRAKQWPEGSEERKLYAMCQGILSKPLPKKPTPEESKALTDKMLGNISSKLRPYAQERYKKDLQNEPEITSDLHSISESLGTGLFGLEHRLKKASDSSDGRCRIEDKIREDMDEKGMSYEQAADSLSDMVRYTQACTPDTMTKNIEKTFAELEKKGYKVLKVKNTWGTFDMKKPYRGVNCVVQSPKGTRFELQFHTPESLTGKEVQHGWYEEFRNPDTPEPRKKELAKRMYENMAAMQQPKDIERIRSFDLTQ